MGGTKSKETITRTVPIANGSQKKTRKESAGSVNRPPDAVSEAPRVPVATTYFPDPVSNEQPRLTDAGPVPTPFVLSRIPGTSWGLVMLAAVDACTGVFVSGVAPESPAEEAGLRVGLHVLEIDGIDMRHANKAVMHAAMAAAGDILPLLVVDNPEGFSANLVKRQRTILRQERLRLVEEEQARLAVCAAAEAQAEQVMPVILAEDATRPLSPHDHRADQHESDHVVLSAETEPSNYVSITHHDIVKTTVFVADDESSGLTVAAVDARIEDVAIDGDGGGVVVVAVHNDDDNEELLDDEDAADTVTYAITASDEVVAASEPADNDDKPSKGEYLEVDDVAVHADAAQAHILWFLSQSAEKDSCSQSVNATSTAPREIDFSDDTAVTAGAQTHGTPCAVVDAVAKPKSAVKAAAEAIAAAAAAKLEIDHKAKEAVGGAARSNSFRTRTSSATPPAVVASPTRRTLSSMGAVEPSPTRGTAVSARTANQRTSTAGATLTLTPAEVAPRLRTESFRQFHTDRERQLATADVEETNKRLSTMTFDFSFS